MATRRHLGLCLALLCGVASVPAQTHPTPAPLALRDALISALRANLGLTIARIDPADARERLQASDSRFDPTFSLQTESTGNRDPAAGDAVDPAGLPRAGSHNVRAELARTFAPGTRVSADIGLARSADDAAPGILDPSYTAAAGVTIAQPLLKGAGRESGLAAVRLGQLAVSDADWALRSAVLDLLEKVENSYWRASAAAEQLRVRDASLALASNLLDEARARAAAGLATSVDVLQAEAEFSSRTGDRLTAIQFLEDSRDALAALLGRLPPNTAVPGDALPAAINPGIPLEDALRRALEGNPEYRRRQLEVESGRINVAKTRQDRLPALDLQVRSGLRGLDEGADQAYASAAQGDGYFWSAGLTLTAPLGGREGKAALTRARLALDRSELSVADFERQLRYALAAANRAVETTGARLRTALLTSKLRTEETEKERARYNENVVSIRDVLAAQSRLAEALLTETNGRTEHLSASAHLSRLQGDALLERQGLSWMDTTLKEKSP